MDSNDREVRQALERTQSELARARRELDDLRRRVDRERLESDARVEEENRLAEAERRRAAEAMQALAAKEARIAELETALSRRASRGTDSPEPGVIIGPARSTEVAGKRVENVDSPHPGVIIGPARQPASDTALGPFWRVSVGLMGFILIGAVIQARDFSLLALLLSIALLALAFFAR